MSSRALLVNLFLRGTIYLSMKPSKPGVHEKKSGITPSTAIVLVLSWTSATGSWEYGSNFHHWRESLVIIIHGRDLRLFIIIFPLNHNYHLFKLFVTICAKRSWRYFASASLQRKLGSACRSIYLLMLCYRAQVHHTNLSPPTNCSGKICRDVFIRLKRLFDELRQWYYSV